MSVRKQKAMRNVRRHNNKLIVWREYIHRIYIDTEWNLQSHCLQANYMPEDHTGEKLQDALIMSFDEWNLNSSKLIAISWPVNYRR